MMNSVRKLTAIFAFCLLGMLCSAKVSYAMSCSMNDPVGEAIVLALYIALLTGLVYGLFKIWKNKKSKKDKRDILKACLKSIALIMFVVAVWFALVITVMEPLYEAGLEKRRASCDAAYKQWDEMFKVKKSF